MVLELRAADGAEVAMVDPHIASFEDHHGRVYHTTPLSDELLEQADCAVVVTDHSAFDYERIVARSRAVVDTRNATRSVRDGREKIILL
jgi:UDP-N-acetyl-D-glucosamine dehydrogenase